MNTGGAPRGTTPASVDQALAILAPGDVYAVASLLEHLAETSGNRAFRRAARALLARVGRRSLDDEAQLAQMARVLAEGVAESLPAAARYVAAKLPGRHSLDSAAKRLERKYRKRLGGNN
jgi:sirohydrochlorin ferrochelatase